MMSSKAIKIITMKVKDFFNQLLKLLRHLFDFHLTKLIFIQMAHEFIYIYQNYEHFLFFD